MADQGLELPVGVGRTALYMAFVRHHESQRPDALFQDPFAEVVMAACAGTAQWDALLADLGATAQAYGALLDSPQYRYFPIRTRYFDDHLTSAMHRGIGQVVSLAAGLDGRPMRLPCPAGTEWYELDLPEVLAYKNTLINASGLAARCTRHGVSADLTADWRAPLREAGFDPAQPTAWLVEGLMMYLTPPTGERLLGELSTLSAPGSELLIEQLNSRMLATGDGVIHQAVRSQNIAFASACDNLETWLAQHGWRASVRASSDPSIGYGRDVPDIGWLADAFRQPHG